MNKRKIIISINPEHVENILKGIKKYEFRTKAAKDEIGSIIIYETSPVKKVVAEVEIIDVLSMNPEELWEETKEYSGISKQFFDKYFLGRTVAYAYKLGKIIKFDKPRTLEDFGLTTAPQSYAYVNV